MDRKKLERKVVLDYPTLRNVVEAQRTLGHRIVVTIGSWDLLHIGHARYLLEAGNNGDILVVGVDSDDAIKKYKGPFRPIVPQCERIEMLTYLDFVSYITLINDVDEKGSWQYKLIEVLRPDLFVAVQDSYPKEQIEQIKEYCKEVIVLPRQAENTSTSDIVQNMLKESLLPVIAELAGGGRKK